MVAPIRILSVGKGRRLPSRQWKPTWCWSSWWISRQETRFSKRDLGRDWTVETTRCTRLPNRPKLRNQATYKRESILNFNYSKISGPSLFGIIAKPPCFAASPPSTGEDCRGYESPNDFKLDESDWDVLRYRQDLFGEADMISWSGIVNELGTFLPGFFMCETGYQPKSIEIGTEH